MWVYEIAGGVLKHEGNLASVGEQQIRSVVVGVGYSGKDPYKNHPECTHLTGLGPIPCGQYTISEPFDTEAHGPFVLALTPASSNEMYGRSGFLMHGDSVIQPGTASDGCIIMARSVREAVSASGDKDLLVVAGAWRVS